MNTDENAANEAAKVTGLSGAKAAASQPGTVADRVTQIEAAEPSEPIKLPPKLMALLSHRVLAKEALILTYRREKSPADNQRHFDFALAALSSTPPG